MHDHEIIDRVVERVLAQLRLDADAAADSLAAAGSGLTPATGACAHCRGACDCHGPSPVTVRRIIDAGACRVSGRYPSGPVEDELSPCIDHTLLKPEATPQQIAALCQEAMQHDFVSVCVNPVYVSLCNQLLHDSRVAVCTVVGFPLGATTTEVKVFETRQAIDQGASEIDMVIHVGALKGGELARVQDDIAAVARACGRDALLKVIIEAALLSDEEKVQASAISRLAGADFVKTSTGFGPGGATLDDVALMRRAVGEGIGVKAAGGIRDRRTAESMIRAGADRIGASASVAIIHEGKTSAT